MRSTELIPYDDTRHARACPGHPRLESVSARTTWMAGHRRAEATPSFGRLCPAMTKNGFRRHNFAISRLHAPELCKNLPSPRGRGECRVPAAPADGVTAPPGAFQASRASYGAVCGARRAACLEGRRSSLTLMV